MTIQQFLKVWDPTIILLRVSVIALKAIVKRLLHVYKSCTLIRKFTEFAMLNIQLLNACNNVLSIAFLLLAKLVLIMDNQILIMKNIIIFHGMRISK